MERKNFVFYKDWWDAIRMLPSDKQAEIVHAVMEYAFTGKEPDDAMLRFATATIRTQIDRDTERYNEICMKRRNSALSRMQKPQNKKDITKEQMVANATKSKQMPPNGSKRSILHYEYDDEYEYEYGLSTNVDNLKKETNFVGKEKKENSTPTTPEISAKNISELQKNRLRPFSDNVAECLASTEWQEGVQMNLGVKITDWQEVFGRFRASLVANGHETEKTLQDFRQHFVNWLRINEESKKRKDDGRNQKNNSGNDRARVCTSVGGEAYPSAHIVPAGRGVSVF